MPVRRRQQKNHLKHVNKSVSRKMQRLGKVINRYKKLEEDLRRIRQQVDDILNTITDGF